MTDANDMRKFSKLVEREMFVEGTWYFPDTETSAAAFNDLMMMPLAADEATLKLSRLFEDGPLFNAIYRAEKLNKTSDVRPLVFMRLEKILKEHTGLDEEVREMLNDTIEYFQEGAFDNQDIDEQNAIKIDQLKHAYQTGNLSYIELIDAVKNSVSSDPEKITKIVAEIRDSQ